LPRAGRWAFPSCAKALGLHERSARDFFDALVTLGMLQRLADGRYANTPETELYLDRNKPTYCGGMLEMMNARLYRFWGHLTEALQTRACRKMKAATASPISLGCSTGNPPGSSSSSPR